MFCISIGMDVKAGRTLLLSFRRMGRSVRTTGGVLVYLRVNEIEIPPCCPGPGWRLSRSQAEVAYGNTCSSSGPTPVSGRRVLLYVGGTTVVPQATVAGYTEVSPAAGRPGQPHRAGRGLHSGVPAMPDGPANAEDRLQVVVGTGQVGCPRGGQKKRAGNLLDPWPSPGPL